MLQNDQKINLQSEMLLPSPGTVCRELPLSPELQEQIRLQRRTVKDIIHGRDKRLLVIAGPCSVHSEQGALEYASRLKKLADKIQDKAYILMRVYFEKPRTALGWKGLIYDPMLDGSCQIPAGIHLARKILLEVLQAGLPTAAEILDPVTSAYLSEMICWGGIGARTVESPVHRQLASGLPMAVGFKNSISGDLESAINAMITVQSSHSYIGVLENGHTGIFRTKGNPSAHLVLRGGASGVNYTEEAVKAAVLALQQHHLNTHLVVDCSHGNSRKDYRQQRTVFHEVMRQRKNGCLNLCGIMLESYLKEGNQKLIPGLRPAYDCSITDGCISWEETEQLLLSI